MNENANEQALVLHGLGWFYERWRQIFERTDKEAIERYVERLRRDYPRETEARLSYRILHRTARSSVLVGVATATPALVPGIGTAISVVGLLPEERYLMRRQCEMVLRIASVYGFDVSAESRLIEVVALCTSPSKSAEFVANAKYELSRIALNSAAELSKPKALLGIKAASRGIVRRLPALGFFAGGALNYYAIVSLGQQAARYYSGLARKER